MIFKSSRFRYLENYSGIVFAVLVLGNYNYGNLNLDFLSKFEIQPLLKAKQT